MRRADAPGRRWGTECDDTHGRSDLFARGISVPLSESSIAVRKALEVRGSLCDTHVAVPLRSVLMPLSNPQPLGQAPKVGSITHALNILRYLSTARRPEGVTAIARALDISTSSCFNILKTLTAEKYVDFDEQTKTYSLGWAPVVLARRALDPDGVLSLLMPQMEEFADRYNIACGLGRVTRNERTMLIGFAQSENATRIQLRVGHRTPVMAGASGKCVAAARGLSAAEIQKGFSALRWQNPPTIKDYLEEVERAGARGWAMDSDNSYRGVTTLASAVCDDAGAVRYVMSATLFSGQYSEETLAIVGADLANLAKNASARLFGPGELTPPPKRAARRAKSSVAKGSRDPSDRRAGAPASV